MTTTMGRVRVAALAGTSLTAMIAASAVSDMMPPEKSMSNLEYDLLARDGLWTCQALDSYG